MFTKSRLTLAVMAISSGLIYAEQPADENVTLLDQITVSASRTAKKVDEVSSSVSVINAETIEEELVSNIKDLVRYEPGVVVPGLGRAGSQGFNIRGMGKNQVKITLDGVSQAQEFFTGGDYLRSQRNFVDTETLKAVEIVKGPASSLYGSETIGGLVAFETKDPSDLLRRESGDDNYGSVKSAYDSENEAFTETLSLANRTGDLESLLIYTRRDHKETETYEGSDTEGSARGKANPMDKGLNNILAKTQYQLDENNRIGLTAEYQKSNTKSDLKSIKDASARIYLTGDDSKQRQRLGIFHDWQANVSLFDHLKWQLDWQRSETEMNTFRPGYTLFPGNDYNDRLLKYDYSETSLSLSTQFDKTLVASGQTHNLIYGFSASNTDVRNKNTSDDLKRNISTDVSYIPTIDVKKYGVFIQDDIKISERLSVIPGIRYDRFEYKPEGKAANTKDDKVTGKLGAVFSLSDDFSIFTQVSQGFKAPGFSEMYYTRVGHGYSNIANPDLKPEESLSYEIGLRGNGNLGSFELTAFDNRYKNFIDSVTIDASQGISQNKNIDKARIKGVELKSQFWLDEAIGAPEGMTLKASIAYAKGENKESDQPLNSVAPLTVVLGLAYTSPSDIWGNEVILTLVQGKKNTDISQEEATSNRGTSQFAPAGYGLVDLTAWYKPVNDLTLRAGLFNLTDKKYWIWNEVRGVSSDYAGTDRYSQSGRNVSVSAKYEF